MSRANGAAFARRDLIHYAAAREGASFCPSSSGATSEAGSVSTYLVTDTGRKYPVVNAQALASLGYGGVAKPPIAGSLLALVPTGPALDPATAGQPAPSGGTG